MHTHTYVSVYVYIYIYIYTHIQSVLRNNLQNSVIVGWNGLTMRQSCENDETMMTGGIGMGLDGCIANFPRISCKFNHLNLDWGYNEDFKPISRTKNIGFRWFHSPFLLRFPPLVI